MNYRFKTFLLPFLDLLLLSISYFLSFLFVQSVEGDNIVLNYEIFLSWFFYLFVSYCSLSKFRTYKTMWKYSGIQEFSTSIAAIVISNFVFLIYSFIFLTGSNLLYTLPLIFIFSIVTISGCRLLQMTKKQSFTSNKSNKKRALIIGAGDAGTRIAQQILRSEDLDYSPIGFIEDDPSKQKMELFGIPVIGNRGNIKNVVEKYRITDIIIAIPSLTKSEMTEIVNECKKTGANVKSLPPVKELIQSDISLDNLREIDLKDLIGREPIMPTKRLKEYLKNKTVLITGAGGSIGSELSKQVAECNPSRIILLGHGENSIFNIGMLIKEKYPELDSKMIITDIQDRGLVEQVFTKYRPQIVFHAAAHKHVPLMEISEGSAIRNNVFGTKNMAEISDRFNVDRFVFISTDKAVQPINMMGMTKRIGELIIQYYSKMSKTKFSIVRFGNVLESRGSVIPIFRKQIEAKGPVTVTHPDMVRYFMTIPEAVQLVLEAGALSEGGEIFVLDMGEPIKIVDVAKKLIRLYGYEPEKEIKIEFTGIRPGEKLTETLFYEHEKSKMTEHPHIVIALPTKTDSFDIKQDLNKLEEVIIKNPDQLRRVIVNIIQHK
ncbi:polysaccharide biosynthesis protein [Metabacillus niabensis]|uniref:polysaccharide biosynthesis protein n=1 Tax=Metabacillus niabensis TaxID=324854 RepID=UPI001CF9D632|nr:nucleoside-diphosphate sugar epimerase/dehydratase [Metabacillus niabensis]